MKVLVVPTIRENSIKNFLYVWGLVNDWDKIIIVEDNPECTFDIDVDYHLSWKNIEEDLGENSWIISKRDSAIRAYGFWKAYQIGADYIFTLDDDCVPIPHQYNFCETHIKNLCDTSKWAESVPGLRTRGTPYRNLGTLDNVAMSVGLWEGIPDLDGIHMLVDRQQTFKLPKTRVMPKDQYFPICGMNLAFKREITPLCYFPLMGQDQPFGRFDDIWFGIIAKKICDHLNLLITCGEPYIHHSKASCPFNNLIKEAPGIKFNESFWEIIDDIPICGLNPSECMIDLGSKLENYSDSYSYLDKLGSALKIWGGLFLK